MAGHASLATPAGSQGIPFLLKYDSLGNLLWTSVWRGQTGGPADNALNEIALGTSGRIALAGRSEYDWGNWEYLLLSYDDLTPRLTMAGVPAPGVRQGCLVSPRWSVFDVVATTNVVAGNWQSIGTVTNHNGLVPFLDREAGLHRTRYYRAREREP